MEAEAATIDKEASLRPASVKPFSIPIPPPWNCVRLAFQTDLTKPENPQINSSVFDIVVARSPWTLVDHYLLFTHYFDRGARLAKVMRDEKVHIDHYPNPDIVLADRCRKVSFVRVILRSYKEGVIEDGAVVCAPRLDDIKLWISG